MNKLLLKHTSLIGVYWGGLNQKQPMEAIRIWGLLLELLEEKKLNSIVFKRIYNGLKEIPIAMDDLANRKTWGKVVVRVQSKSTSKL